MRIERILQDGSLDFGQAGIGPSRADRKLFNNSQMPSLGHFPTRTDLITSTGAVLMVPFLAGCNTVSSQGTESQSSDSSSTDHNSVDNTTLIEEENINAGTRSESELLDTFLKEGKKYGNLYDWTRFLGIPDEALSVYSEISELLEDPQKTLEEYFERIPNIDNARPQRGDMVLIKPSDTWKMGVGGIATGVERIEGEAIFEDVLLPMNWEKPESHKITEFLGWLRPRIPDSNGSIAVQGEDTGLEGGEFGQKYLKEMLSKFINEYNQQTVDFDGAYGAQCVDLVQLWNQELGGDRFTGDAWQIFGQNPFSFISVPNTGSNRPPIGSIVVWGTDFGEFGHTAIATGKGEKDENGTYNFEAFGQNYPIGSPSKTSTHTLNNSVLGWLVPVQFVPEEVIEDGIYEPLDPSEYRAYFLRRGVSEWLPLFNRMNQKRDDEGREFYVRTGMEDVDLWKERISEIGDAMLAINDIHTEDTWPGGRIDNMIEEMTNDEPIRFSWVITDFKSKYTGEAEFKLFYINARDGRPPSETDSMNGWEWKNGTMAVKFHFRYRANRYLKSPTKDMAWFKSIDTEYNEDFSEWHERYDGLYFEKRDGVWRLERTFPPRGFFDYIIEGSQVLEPFPMQWLFVKDGVWCEPNQAGTGGGLCD